VSPLNRFAWAIWGACWSLREWLSLRYPIPFFEARGLGDVGRLAFIASQDRFFKEFLTKLLAAKKITDPQLVHERKGAERRTAWNGLKISHKSRRK
jgi:hypothetical protein